VTLSDLAAEIKVSPRTVMRWVNAGSHDIPAPNIRQHRRVEWIDERIIRHWIKRYRKGDFDV
jgi:hypothetical protein